LAGDARLVFRNKPSSTRLKIPGIDLYSAGGVEADKETESIEYTDKTLKVYKRLFIKGCRITGMVLYGDTLDGPRLFSSLMQAEDISGKRGRLLMGEGLTSGATLSSIAGMPADRVVCGCNGVTKGAIVDAIRKKGLFTREDVIRETKASGSCGGCAGMVNGILEATLGLNFQGQSGPESLCACTIYSRDDIIKNIREKGLRSVNEVMETLGWESVGCEKCRPAINYYIQMVCPGDGLDDPSSRLINERVSANIQKDNSFSVIPRAYGGVVLPEELKRIADAAVKYGVPLVKITGGQRIGLFGVKRENLQEVWRACKRYGGI
ncbi:MAG: NAD(P)/FAD-dependent oxidoreductase, partial [Deltaproteobacteria bacterium]|nr:NAD(P)/FAD-dependent oxidoreductase [Deltaproteobacteria bacterium]